MCWIWLHTFPLALHLWLMTANRFISRICKYRSFPSCIRLTLREVGCKSNFTQVRFGYSCVQLHKMESSWNINSQRTGTWWTAACPPCHLCYHPPEFFRHLRLIALSVPRVELRTAFWKCCYSILYKTAQVKIVGTWNCVRREVLTYFLFTSLSKLPYLSLVFHELTALTF